jgi:hypothetical protein
MEDCVRARVCSDPLRTPAQLRQLQFHCGNPPPAAEPRTRIFTADSKRARQSGAARPIEPGARPAHTHCSHRWVSARNAHEPARLLTPSASALGDVHRDFHAEPEISRLRSFPFHMLLLHLTGDETAGRRPSLEELAAQALPLLDAILPHCAPPSNPHDHESGLMIFMSRERRATRTAPGRVAAATILRRTPPTSKEPAPPMRASRNVLTAPQQPTCLQRRV